MMKFRGNNMQRPQQIVSLFACAILYLSANAIFLANANAEDRPNVILVMADDHGWGDTGYHGHPFAKTPNLDSMAEEGLRFHRWYAAAPVCSPTRGSCLTGRHPHRYGIYFANKGRLEPYEICLAEVLQKHGYATGHFGKWHLGTLTTKVKDANRGGPGSEAVYSPPWENGFDVCFSTESKVPTYDPMIRPAAVSRESKGGPGGSYGTYYWTGPEKSVAPELLRGDDSKLIVDQATRFIDSAISDEKNFFAVIWFHAPHTPVVADKEHRDLYPDHPHGLYGQHYHGCITAMDEQIGRVRTLLKERGVAENTMLWYSSDNGPESSATTGAGSAGKFRGRKRSLYEGGVRVPGLLVWPAKIKAARQTEMPCVTSDYFPTVLDALGLDLPDREYDGISLLPLIAGDESDRSKPIGFRSNKNVAWIDGSYKLISNNLGKTWELYNLTDDPSEKNDLAAADADRVRSMANAAKAWLESCQNSVDATLKK